MNLLKGVKVGEVFLNKVRAIVVGVDGLRPAGCILEILGIVRQMIHKAMRPF
jgi:hypothetical protein